ncbi:hypothetical protein HFN_0356 [Helicobacter fennelliae MRY12-0050]|uniref:Uncharacterized protein n=1 Tax=Helicobacter fennelliae MRY12-0050 TaxID=1325130 RepID=T1CZ53_9HELI|nr:hypothetical protein HFN_0356 [Helicobacter fennelliae MRY12-0050]
MLDSAISRFYFFFLSRFYFLFFMDSSLMLRMTKNKPKIHRNETCL